MRSADEFRILVNVNPKSKLINFIVNIKSKLINFSAKLNSNLIINFSDRLEINLI